MATCNPTTLLESAKCFQCLSKKEIAAAITQLLCVKASSVIARNQQLEVSAKRIVPVKDTAFTIWMTKHPPVLKPHGKFPPVNGHL